MFFLKANTCEKPIILHIRGGYINEAYGFIANEGIFEVEQRSSKQMAVVRRVGTVQVINGELFFEYTAEFKLEIAYREDSGYSTLDGAAWIARPTSYIGNDGKSRYERIGMLQDLCLYLSAKKPFQNAMPNLNLFFSPDNKKREENIVCFNLDSGSSSKVQKK